MKSQATAQRYRREAEECEAKAKRAEKRVDQEAWLRLAADWTKLARGAELTGAGYRPGPRLTAGDQAQPVAVAACSRRISLRGASPGGGDGSGVNGEAEIEGAPHGAKIVRMAADFESPGAQRASPMRYFELADGGVDTGRPGRAPAASGTRSGHLCQHRAAIASPARWRV